MGWGLHLGIMSGPTQGVNGSFLLDFIGTGVLPGHVTFTRASTATYWDASGVMQTAAVDTPRFDHDPITLAPRGLLMEGSRTNRLLRNRQMLNAAWTATNMAVAYTQVGTDGVANSAALLTASAANGTITQAFTLSAANRTLSFWMKRATGTGNIQLTQNNGTNWTTVTVGSGWTRVSLTASVLNPTVGIRIVTSGDAVVCDYGQFEDGTFATSAIVTEGASVTRAGGFCRCDTPALVGYSADAYTTLWEFSHLGFTSGTAQIVGGFSANTGADRAPLFYSTVDTLQQANIVSNVINSSLNVVTGPVAGTVYKVASSFTTDRFRSIANGGTIQQDNGGTPVTGTSLILGNRDGATLPMFGHIRKLTIWPTQIEDTALEALVA